MSGVGGAAGAAAYHFNQRQASYMRGVEAAKSGESKSSCTEQGSLEKTEWEKGFDDVVTGRYREPTEEVVKPISRWKLIVRVVLITGCLILVSWLSSFS